jgi:DNA polymerase-3 subunit alpha
VMELEKIKKEVVSEIQAFEPSGNENEEELLLSEGTDEEETATVVETTIEEEIIVVTKLSMPSRKLKIQISNELLQELEALQINFKLN